MEKSKLKTIIKRVISSLVLAPVVLLAVFSGSPAINLLALLGGALLAREWATMIPNNKPTVYAVSYMFPLSLSVFTSDVWTISFVILFVTCWMWVKTAGENHRRLLTLGVPYITIGIGSLVWLFNLSNPLIVIWFILVIWSVDIGGYVVGCNLKGPKLAPKISPNKTWSGLLGGMIFAATVSSAYFYLMGGRTSYIVLAVIGMVIAVIEQAGDLIESSIKRYLGIKDSSQLIPGHGGIFDRVDGMIFAAPFVVLWFLFG